MRVNLAAQVIKIIVNSVDWLSSAFAYLNSFCVDNVWVHHHTLIFEEVQKRTGFANKDRV